VNVSLRVRTVNKEKKIAAMAEKIWKKKGLKNKKAEMVISAFEIFE